MKNLQEISSSPAMNPIDAARYVNVNKIADGIEKATIVLESLLQKEQPNFEAIATWERIRASLQMRWRDCMINVQTNGRYSFQ
jgi:hypothetical protein